VVQFLKMHGLAKYLLPLITNENGSSLLTHTGKLVRERGAGSRDFFD
jgi:hypothetical protein